MTKHPVVWFEVLGHDGRKLQRYFSDLFGWSMKVEGPFNYGSVDPTGGARQDEKGNDGTVGSSGTAGRDDQGGAKSDERRGIPGGVGTTFPGTRPWVTFYVATDDLEATMKKALALGGKLVMPPTALPEGPPVAFFEDPEGHVIGLVNDGTANAP